MGERICVLTGDIVRSTRLASQQLDAVMQALVEGSDAVRQWTTPASPPLERFRGDGWQLALTNPALTLRAGLVLRASVRRIANRADTRIGFGIGPARLARNLAASSGPAFEHSGRQLEKLKGPARWALHTEDLQPNLVDVTLALFAACEGWSRGWTSKQAETVFHLLQMDEPAIGIVAERLGVRPQTTQAHFAKAGGMSLLQVIHLFEKQSA